MIPNPEILKHFITLKLDNLDPIVKHTIEPFQKCIVDLEYQLNILEKNGLYRIKVDLKENE